MKMILEQASNPKRYEIVEIDTVEQILELIRESQTDLGDLGDAGVVITPTSLLNMLHEDPDIKWHITIYDGYIE